MHSLLQWKLFDTDRLYCVYSVRTRKYSAIAICNHMFGMHARYISDRLWDGHLG